MGGFIAILIIAIAALIRNNMNLSKRLKSIRDSNSEYNKIFEENLNLQEKNITLEIENINLQMERNNLLLSIVRSKTNHNGKLPITYSVN